jgi:hypothetical protein
VQRGLFLLAGLALGALGAFYLRWPSAPASGSAAIRAPLSTTADAAARRSAEPTLVAALATRPSGTTERAALYAFASHADLRALDDPLIEAAALEDQTARAFALDVLLQRAAELNAAAAVTSARRLRAPFATIAAVYYTWLLSAPNAALAALGSLDEQDARAIAAELIARVGDDRLTIDRIVASVPPAIADSLTATALARIARGSPAEAFARAREINDPLERASALRAVLSTWAESDPSAALKEADALDDEPLRASMRAVALGLLAQRDGSAALRYLTALDREGQREAFRGGLWQQLAASAPGLVLERIDAFPPNLRAAVEQTALQSLATRDPRSAMARVAQMPPGAPRQQLVQIIANGLGQRDADGALAWARSLQPPDAAAVAAVIGGIAMQDAPHALDLAAQIADPNEQAQALTHVVTSSAMRDGASSERLLERVLALGNVPQRQMLVQMTLRTWAARAPEEAADWLLANATLATPEVVAQVASQYATFDAASAAAFATRLPAESRGAWLRGVATAYASTDPRGALDWVEQLRGTPEYDETANAILINGAAQYEPAAAARLLDSIDDDNDRQTAVFNVALRWARQDPPAAASWAAAERGDAARVAAMGAVTQVWAARDARAAQAWVLGQPSSAARDAALQAIFTTAARTATPDVALLANFSTEQARLNAVQGAATAIAQRSSDDARQFITANVADHAQRERLLSFMDQMATMRSRGAIGPQLNVATPFDSQGTVMQLFVPGVAVPAGAVGASRSVNPPPAR